MMEKNIEKRLVKEVKNKGGLALKLTSPSLTGIPDRLVLLPGGKSGFVEVKRKGEKPRAIQVKRIKELKDLGFKVYILDDENDIDKILREIGGGA